MGPEAAQLHGLGIDPSWRGRISYETATASDGANRHWGCVSAIGTSGAEIALCRATRLDDVTHDSKFDVAHHLLGWSGRLSFHAEPPRRLDSEGPLRAAGIAARTMLNVRTPRAAAAINNDVEAIVGVEEVVSV
jgi:hypothetical protein